MVNIQHFGDSELPARLAALITALVRTHVTDAYLNIEYIEINTRAISSGRPVMSVESIPPPKNWNHEITKSRT